jgi:hypothetical protein
MPLKSSTLIRAMALFCKSLQMKKKTIMKQIFASSISCTTYILCTRVEMLPGTAVKWRPMHETVSAVHSHIGGHTSTAVDDGTVSEAASV